MVKIVSDEKYLQRIYFKLKWLREFYLVLGNLTVNVLLTVNILY